MTRGVLPRVQRSVQALADMMGCPQERTWGVM